MDKTSMSTYEDKLGTLEEAEAFARKRNYAFQTYKTVEQQETEAILAMGEMHDNQRETIFRLGEQVQNLEKALAQANERVRQLESQVYGGSVK
jgi:hypothetical protein